MGLNDCQFDVTNLNQIISSQADFKENDFIVNFTFLGKRSDNRFMITRDQIYAVKNICLVL